MDKKTLANIQMILGVVAILFWLINFVMTGVSFGSWYIGTNNAALLLFGIFATITGRYNLK